MTVPAILLAVIVALAVGGLCGAFNGFIIGFFDIPAMLVTLCGLQLYKGLAYGITGGPAINGMCDEFKAIANGSNAGIPYVLFIFIAVLVVVSFVMKSTGQQCAGGEVQRNQYAQGDRDDAYVQRDPGWMLRHSDYQPFELGEELEW